MTRCRRTRRQRPRPGRGGTLAVAEEAGSGDRANRCCGGGRLGRRPAVRRARRRSGLDARGAGSVVLPRGDRAGRSRSRAAPRASAAHGGGRRRTAPGGCGIDGERRCGGKRCSPPPLQGHDRRAQPGGVQAFAEHGSCAPAPGTEGRAASPVWGATGARGAVAAVGAVGARGAVGAVAAVAAVVGSRHGGPGGATSIISAAPPGVRCSRCGGGRDAYLVRPWPRDTRRWLCGYRASGRSRR